METLDQNNTNDLNLTSEEKQRRIKSHKKAALYLQAAAQHHLEAAVNYEANNHSEAVNSNVSAQEHALIAIKEQEENLKLFALTSKPVI